MESKSIYQFFYFGTCFRYLQDVTEGTEVHFADGGVVQNLDWLFENINGLDLSVTKNSRPYLRLKTFSDKIRRTDPPHMITKEEVGELNGSMKDLRDIIDAEIFGKEAFVITEKRIDAKKLINDVRALMAPGVFDSLAPIAQYDFSQAGKCIAFEVPTAAAFHILRGTESVLRDFYCKIVKQKKVKPLLWGPMVQGLRVKRKGPPEVLLNNLDNIRLSFRNPTDHPEKVYDIQEAQDLFGLCMDVVNRMSAYKGA